MALFDRIKYEVGTDEELVWKFPSDDITLGSQLVVSTTQEVVFRKNGKNADVFTAGVHTLSTSNLPVVGSIIGSVFGGKTPFTAEVWFVNKTPKRDLKWGTTSPIPLIEPKYNVPVSVRAFGQWGIQIVDSLLFVEELVGNRKFSAAEQVYEYFRGELIQDMSQTIATMISEGKSSLFDVNAKLSEVASKMLETFSSRLLRYGIRVTNLSIDRISIPQNELQRLQDIMLKRMEVDQLASAPVTDNFKTVKSLDILHEAASNPAGGIAPLVMQAGFAAGMGNAIAKETLATSPQDSIETRLSKLKLLLEKGLISQADFDKKKNELLTEL